MVFICCMAVSCNGLKHTVYYQESKFPNSLEAIQLNILNDSTGEVITTNGPRHLRFNKIGKHYYRIDSSLILQDSSLYYLTTDTLVFYKSKIYVFNKDVKLIFKSKL